MVGRILIELLREEDNAGLDDVCGLEDIYRKQIRCLGMPMGDLIKKANQIRTTDGYSVLIKKMIGFVYANSLRRIMPTRGYYTLAGVRVYEKKFFDSFIPGLQFSSNPDHESAIISQLQEHVKTGDRVVVVGAGSGTTCVIAANRATSNGSVIAFEGSANSVARAQRTISINGVDNFSKVHHAVVGPPIHLSNANGEQEPEKVPPEELPDCDVLELDCEGAEKEILQKMNISPRVVIVETHPHFSSDPDKIGDILSQKGFIVVNQVNRKQVPVLTAVKDRQENS